MSAADDPGDTPGGHGVPAAAVDERPAGAAAERAHPTASAHLTPGPTDPSAGLPHRPIRSYVLRQGRVSVAQQRALDEYRPRFCLPFQGRPLEFPAVFGRRAPLVVEIGFGMGETTALIARSRPEVDFIGVEVHTPGVGALLKTLAHEDIGNVRVVQHDAVEVLQSMIPPGSLAGIHIFFPDPWPKARHHKRRLLQTPFVRLAAGCLAAGGYLHCATDWEEYAQQMLDVLAREPMLANTAEGFRARPEWRPRTKFETRGLGLGHGVWDVVFERVPPGEGR